MQATELIKYIITSEYPGRSYPQEYRGHRNKARLFGLLGIVAGILTIHSGEFSGTSGLMLAFTIYQVKEMTDIVAPHTEEFMKKEWKKHFPDIPYNNK